MVLLFGIDKKQDKIYDNIDPCPQKFHHCSHDNSSNTLLPLENLKKKKKKNKRRPLECASSCSKIF